MHRTLFFSFLLLFSAELCAAAATNTGRQEAAFAVALQQASAPAVTLYQNDMKDKEEEFLYQQAFNFLLVFPPQGRKAVFDLKQTDMPNAHIYIYIAPSEKLRQTLRGSGFNPDMVLPAGTNGVTLPLTQKNTGFKKLFVMIASDLILGDEPLVFPLTQAKREEALAKLSALLAHEIYGHAYLYAFDPRLDIPRKEQEIYAYEQSASFLARIAAHPELKQRPGLIKELNKARETENYLRWVWSRR